MADNYELIETPLGLVAHCLRCREAANGQGGASSFPLTPDDAKVWMDGHDAAHTVRKQL